MARDGRSGALTAMLGILAAVLLASVGVAVTLIVMSGDDDPVAAPPVIETVVESAAPPPPPPVETEPAYVPPTPTGSAVVQGGPCFESEVRSFGTSADGQSLVCIYAGGDGYAWVGHGANSGEVHNIGDPCSSPEDQVAVDPSGRAIMCGGSVWTAGP